MAEVLVKLLNRALHHYEGLVNRIDEVVDPFEIESSEPTRQAGPEAEFEYRPDTLWARPVMWWEMALGATGVGTYLSSVAAGSVSGRLVGAALVLGGKGSLLMADLGRPERAIRVFTMPHTSWISRGAWALGVFSLGVGGQLACRRPAIKTKIELVTALAAAVLISYDGLFLNASKGVSGWTRKALPLLLTSNGLLTGAVVSRLATTEQPRLQAIVRAAGIAQAASTTWYLLQLSNGDPAAQECAAVLLDDHEARRFGIGAGLVGLALPVAATFCPHHRRVPQAASAIAAVFGAAWLRKSILRAGRHAPIIAPIDEAGWPW